MGSGMTREARLRPEFAHVYPGVPAGVWMPAADMGAALLMAHLQLSVLPRLGNRLLDEAHRRMSTPRLLVFDRTWAERGTYTGWVRVNGLEDSYPTMLRDWAAQNPRAVVTRFDQTVR